MPPGSSSRSLTSLPRRSSNIPILAAARNRRRWRKRIEKRYEADPVSAFGGVSGLQSPVVDEETATEIAKTFIEAIAAPGYKPEALAILQGKKNLRLLEVARHSRRSR